MLDRMLSVITESKDYLTAISLFTAQKPMTKKETGKLLEVYAKYVPGAEDPAYARLCMAVDLLSRQTEREYLAPLELGENNLEALLTTKSLLEQNREVSKEEIQAMAAQVRNEELDLGVRVILARTALNIVGYSRNFVRIREEINALAGFLTDCGSEVLDRYTELVAEVRYKCRQVVEEGGGK